jgi:hypothetical protein
MKLRFFDFEVTPNWWLCVLGDLPDNTNLTENIKNNFVVIHSDMYNARGLLLELLREDNTCVMGYNIKSYDLPIANAIYQGFTPQQVKIVSDMIINPELQFASKEHLRLYPFTKRKLKSLIYQDLYDDADGTLKEKEAILGLNILESSVPFDKEDLSEFDKEDLIYYCKQDVYAAMKYYKESVYLYTNTKLSLGKYFNIEPKICHASTNATLVGLALEATRNTYADTDRIDIQLPSKIREYCYDNLPSKIIEHICNSKEALNIDLFDNNVDFGNGGLHSIIKNDIYVETNNEWVLVNVDAESYYPSMMIQFNTLSRSVTNPDVFKRIFNERMRIKHKENKTKEDDELQTAYKLVLNTTYGASGNKWLDLYDLYNCSKTCRIGQIFLAALANKIYKTINCAKIIQTNTDGILVYLKVKDLDLLKKLIAEWTNVSGINMEMEFVQKIWQKNVNNYLLVKKNGKVKSKGLWLRDDFRQIGSVKLSPLAAHVCQKAAKEYLLNNTDIITYIVNHDNLRNFVMTCTKGPTYRGVVQKFDDGTQKELFKCNRVIASKNTSLGKIYKYKLYKGEIRYAQMPNIPDNCELMNEDLDSYDISKLKSNIDYSYYIKRTIELLNVDWITFDNKGNFVTTNIFSYSS